MAPSCIPLHGRSSAFRGAEMWLLGACAEKRTARYRTMRERVQRGAFVFASFYDNQRTGAKMLAPATKL